MARQRKRKQKVSSPGESDKWAGQETTLVHESHLHSTPEGVCDHAEGADAKALKLSLGITLAIFVLELAGGYYSNSLSLLSDAGHMLHDTFGLLIALYVVRVCQNIPTKTRTFGFHRTEVLAALANGIILILISGLIFFEGINRLSHPEPIKSGVMLGIAAIGLLANLFVARKLGGFRGINMRAAYLHVLADSLSSVAVIAAALVISLTGLVLVDAFLAFFIALFILAGTIPLIREAIRILMQGTPPGVDVDELIGELESARKVRGVHNVHVWSMCSDVNVLDCHVYTEKACTMLELEEIKKELRQKAEKFGIRHTTFEFECEKCDKCEILPKITHVD